MILLRMSSAFINGWCAKNEQNGLMSVYRTGINSSHCQLSFAFILFCYLTNKYVYLFFFLTMDGYC